MTVQKILVAGEWRDSKHETTFRAIDPSSRQELESQFPVSSWEDCEACLESANRAAAVLCSLPGTRLAEFLERFADRIEARRNQLVAVAHAETALPVSPRLADVELPRTAGQLRQAASAARDGSWANATIDTKAGIRSVYGPLGPVCVFGPNNFPFAFGSMSGGDFAAAIAAGNPVIAKANSSHPDTTRLFAIEAQEAAAETDMPPGTVQLIYRLQHRDGNRLVADARIGATGYTGSRQAGLALKAAADAAGKPIYLELSSINPVIILPGALDERAEEIADEFTTSCLMGTGQFCTNPGLVVLIQAETADHFVEEVSQRFRSAAVGTLLSAGVENKLTESIRSLLELGAVRATPRPSLTETIDGDRFCYPNTLLRVDAKSFLANAEGFQVEAFGNASLVVVADDLQQACQVLDRLEGNLTGCVYSAKGGDDDAAYDELVPHLRQRVGRLLNDKMPTGVAVSPAMNHGGPFPATGHPGFTAVGIPASLPRFSMLQCYDSVRLSRLPAALRDPNPTGAMWRTIDGRWTQDDVGP